MKKVFLCKANSKPTLIGFTTNLYDFFTLYYKSYAANISIKEGVISFFHHRSHRMCILYAEEIKDNETCSYTQSE